jgi:hypothetical protein
MYRFFTWLFEYPEWAAIGMSAGAALGLLTQYLIS